MTQNVVRDVSTKETLLHVLDEAGQRIWRGRCTTEPAAIAAAVRRLADATHVGVATVRLFESEATEMRPATLAVLRRAFETAGVEITNGDQPGRLPH